MNSGKRDATDLSTRAAYRDMLAHGKGLDAPGLSRKQDALHPPGAFTLVSPANAATGISVTPTLTWTDSDDESSYILEISTVGTFASILYSKRLDRNVVSHDVASGVLSAGTTYYWRVRGENIDGSRTASNAPFSFTTAP